MAARAAEVASSTARTVVVSSPWLARAVLAKPIITARLAQGAKVVGVVSTAVTAAETAKNWDKYNTAGQKAAAVSQVAFSAATNLNGARAAAAAATAAGSTLFYGFASNDYQFRGLQGDKFLVAVRDAMLSGASSGAEACSFGKILAAAQIATCAAALYDISGDRGLSQLCKDVAELEVIQKNIARLDLVVKDQDFLD